MEYFWPNHLGSNIHLLIFFMEFLEAKEELLNFSIHCIRSYLPLISLIPLYHQHEVADCDTKLTERTPPRSLSISLLMAPISLSMSLVRELEVEEERAEG